MWLNGGADLIMALACGNGVSDPIPLGAAAGLLEKLAIINAGTPEGLLCALAITSIRNGLKHCFSVLSQTDGTAKSNGRVHRALPSEISGAYAAVLEKQLDELKRVAR